jgi:hypothetical protein
MKEKDKDINNYLMDLAEELEKRIEAEEVEPVYSSELTVMENAFMLTQYQHGNAPVTFNEFAEFFQNEVMGEPSVEQVMLFLIDNFYEDCYFENTPATFNEVISGSSWDIAAMLYRGGHWNPDDDWVKYDCDSITSCSVKEIMDKYGDDTKRYLFETQKFESADDPYGERECIYDDSEIIIEYCNRMLRDGL